MAGSLPGNKMDRNDDKNVKKVQPSESFPMAVILTLVGGFLDAYTYVCRDGVFANAQTGNFARLAISLAQGNLFDALRYFASIMAFVAGVTIAMRICFTMKKSTFLHWRQVCVLLEIVLLVGISFIPVGDISNIFANVLVSLTCAIQVETFRRFQGNVFASTMCTGNLRNATENLNHFWQTGNHENRDKSVRYFSIDITFVVGAVIGTLCTKAWSVRAVLVCCAALAVCFLMMTFGGREEE